MSEDPLIHLPGSVCRLAQRSEHGSYSVESLAAREVEKLDALAL
jgi:hypothetical protein